jgi:hypothetical protein
MRLGRHRLEAHGNLRAPGHAVVSDRCGVERARDARRHDYISLVVNRVIAIGVFSRTPLEESPGSIERAAR